jgi:hypothetical protein
MKSPSLSAMRRGNICPLGYSCQRGVEIDCVLELNENQYMANSAYEINYTHIPITESGFTGDDKLPNNQSETVLNINNYWVTYQGDAFLGHLTSDFKRVIL